MFKRSLAGGDSNFRTPPNSLLNTIARIFAIVICVASTWAHAELKEIWITDDGTKLSPVGDIQHKDSLQRDDGTVTLFGMPNETVAMQVVLEGGDSDTKTELVLKSLGTIENTSQRPPAHSYFLNRHIDVYEAKAVAIGERSHDLSWKPGSEAEPLVEGPSVYEPLGVFKNPVLVPKHTRKVIWIDVWIPKTMPKGKVVGKLKITAEKTTLIPIELNIGSHPLPDVPTTKTMLWSSVFEHENKYVFARYHQSPTQPQIDALRLEHHRLAKRHRVTLINGVYRGNVSEAQPYLSGAAYTTQQGYSGPGEGTGDDLLTLHTYGGDLLPEENQKWKALLSKLKQKPEVIHYTYDEPSLKNEKTIQIINRRSAQSHPFKSFVTHSYDKRILVDVFASLASNYRIGKQQGKHNASSWIYNGVLPHTGSFAIDDVAVSPRVNPWLQFKHQIARWFYWEATYYNDFQGKRGQIDVWKHAGNFSNRHDDLMNGDGLLFYPGTDLLFPGSNQGVFRPLPSIRLKNWRRGIEDIEYLVHAKAKGLDTERFVEKIIPKALDQVRSGQRPSWPQDGTSWRRVRKELFDFLEYDIAPPFDLKNNTSTRLQKDSWLSWWPFLLPGLGALIVFITLKKIKRSSKN